MARERIRVAMVPDYREGNPYQHLLAQALQENDVEVTFPPVGRPRDLLQVKGDILHIHWFPFWFPPETWKVPRRIREFFRVLDRLRTRGVRVVYTVHNERDHESVVRPFWVRWTEGRGRKAFYARVDGFVFHCGDVLWKVPEAMDRPSVVYPHPDLSPAYPERVDKIEARKRLGYAEGERILLVFGQIRPYKNLDRWARALESAPSLRLVIAGECRLPGGCDPLRRPGVDLVDRRLSDEEVTIYLSAADGVLIPQFRMLTSGVVSLAMGFGKPLIVPRVGCNPEVVPQDAGIRVDPGDPRGPERVLAAFSRLDHSALERMGERGRVWIRRWTFRRFAEFHRRLYEEVLG